MSEDIHTLELAKLYEKQEYYDDALKVYQALADRNGNDPEIEQAIERIRALAGAHTEFSQAESGPNGASSQTQAVSTETSSMEKIASLCEKWVRLVVLRHRFRNFKNIKARLN